MDWEDPDGIKIYKVVKNVEGEYSTMPADRETPLGWTDTGMSGTLDECTDYVGEVWTDMRLLSIRKVIEEQGHT